MTDIQKKRLLKSLKKIGIVLAIGIAYALFVRLTGWGIPCVIYLATDRYCPGCGISRMFMALLRLDLAAALRSNALVLMLLPFGLIFGIRRLVIYVKTGRSDTDRLETTLLIPAAVLTVVFWILRNLPAFSFLAPH